MKKILIIIILLTVLTGCRKEDKLTCYKIKNKESMVISEEVEVEFIGNKVTDLSMNVDVNFDKNTSFLVQTLKTTLINNFKKYETNGAIIEVDTEDNSIEFDIDFDLKRMSLKQKKSIDLIDVYGTKLVAKKELESKGYVCR